MHVTIDGLAWLNKAELTEHQINSYKHILTIIPKKSVKKGPDPKPLVLFEESETHIGIPREYYFQHRYQNHHTIKYNITYGNQYEFNHGLQFSGNEKLLEEQQKACDIVVDYFEKGRLGGILQAVPGFGKTVAFCYIASQLKVPTIIFVHKNFLLRQWKERIERFLPNANIGIVQGKEVDFRGKDIVIVMLQTLANDNVPKDFYEWPGLVGVDECHHMGSQTWAPLVGKFACRYRLGLSGTPRRLDSCEAGFFYHLGPKIYVSKEKRLPFKVKRVYTTFDIFGFSVKQLEKMDKCKKIDFMIEDRERNQILADQIAKAVDANRRPLILSERRDHLITLKEMYEKTFLLNYPSKILPEASCFMGKMKEEEQDEALTKQVIFATYQIAREALDVAPLDTLVMATPIEDLDQAAGRIRRFFFGKKGPIIVDMQDQLKWCRYLARQRELYYKKEGANPPTLTTT